MSLAIVGCWEDHAIVAADSAACVKVNGRISPMHLFNKIHQLSASSVVATGRGTGIVFASLIMECVAPALRLDGLAENMPVVFQRANRRVENHPEMTANATVENPWATEFIIVGRSRKHGGMAGYVFAQSARDTLTRREICPGSAWFGPWYPEWGLQPCIDDIATDAGIVSVATQQRDALLNRGEERGGPGIAGGPLVVARLDRSRITIEQIADLGTGRT